MQYKSKYPEIIMDNNNNSPNGYTKYNLTVEQYYDLLHHTHNSSDLVGGSGEGGGSNISQTVSDLVKKVEALQNTVNKQDEIIKSLNTTIQGQNENIEQISKQIDDISGPDSGIVDVGDWDVETPGIQDINGNTIG